MSLDADRLNPMVIKIRELESALAAKDREIDGLRFALAWAENFFAPGRDRQPDDGDQLEALMSEIRALLDMEGE